MTLHHQTPLLHGELPDGRHCLLKMECWQPAGSFKLRGIGRLCEEAARAGARRVVSSSGGNAGLAAAWAARALEVSALVIVPETTSAAVRARLEGLGAEVRVAGSVWDEADAVARELAAGPESAYIPPFDHPAIWDGHATLIAECAAQGPKPDAVVVSVGGGGLLCGVLQGLEDVGWTDVPVYGVETEGAASLAASLRAGELVSIDAIRSIATTLGARRVAPEVLVRAERQPLASVLVTDGEAVAACLAFADSHRVLVEPACGAALAAAGLGRIPGERPLIVVCGGAGVSLEQLRHWEAQVPGVAAAAVGSLRPVPERHG